MRSKRPTVQDEAIGPRLNARINGVDLGALGEHIGAIRAQRKQGYYRFRAHNRWLDGGHTRTTVKDIHRAGHMLPRRTTPATIESNLPAGFHADDRALFPLELMLAAAASCLTTTLVWHASARGLHLDAVETLVDGHIDLAGALGVDAESTPGYRAIRVTVVLESDAPGDLLDELVDTAAGSSPVLDTIRHGAHVNVCRGQADIGLDVQNKKYV